jgi:hypothetical protein
LRDTPVGRLRFVCIRSRVYNLPEKGHMAGPEQALLDFVYMARREGARAVNQLTLQSRERFDASELSRLAKRYPGTVRREAAGLGMREAEGG